MNALGRILIVDDEHGVRDVLGEYFTSQGYAVETAPDGATALAAFRRDLPHLVLLDVRMPGLDGVEVLRRIRDLDASVPIIMVTANEDVALARETLKIGAFDYVSKPFDFAYLDRVVAAGLMHGGASADRWEKRSADADPWKQVALAVFRAVRGLDATGRASTGERLETAALAAASEAAAGRPGLARQHLTDIELLVGIAADLGDLSPADRELVETALDTARRSLARAD